MRRTSSWSGMRAGTRGMGASGGPLNPSFAFSSSALAICLECWLAVESRTHPGEQTAADKLSAEPRGHLVFAEINSRRPQLLSKDRSDFGRHILVVSHTGRAGVRRRRIRFQAQLTILL